LVEFGFSETHEDLRRAAREFATRELALGAKERAETIRIPNWMIKKIAELGYVGMIAEEKYGGQSMDMMSVGIVAEEFGKVDITAPTLVTVPSAYCFLLKYGSEELRRQWLPKLCRGELIGAFGLTEPSCGTDAAALKMTASRNGGSYILDGEKAPVSRAMQAGVFLVWAKTSPEDGGRGISCFLVPADTPGISCSEIPFAGQRPTNFASVFFDSVKVPSTNRVGDEGKGFHIVMEAFDLLRVWIGLAVLGQAETSLDEVTAYVKSRTAFGHPIAKFEAISFRIAEAATKLDAGRLLCYRALWMFDRGLKNIKESAMCKWYATETAVDIIHDCILMMGHYGYSTEYPLVQRMLDVMGYQIAEGTPEALKLVIVREVLGGKFLPYR
jgi:cyclohexanecarboxyl-CoA dehydrogenase